MSNISISTRLIKGEQRGTITWKFTNDIKDWVMDALRNNFEIELLQGNIVDGGEETTINVNTRAEKINVVNQNMAAYVYQVKDKSN